MYMGKINLYFSIVKYDDMPIEMKYLNIVQALETYHARLNIMIRKSIRNMFYNCLDVRP